MTPYRYRHYNKDFEIAVIFFLIGLVIGSGGLILIQNLMRWQP